MSILPQLKIITKMNLEEKNTLREGALSSQTQIRSKLPWIQDDIFMGGKKNTGFSVFATNVCLLTNN